jgi:hypothetical protein
VAILAQTNSTPTNPVGVFDLTRAGQWWYLYYCHCPTHHKTKGSDHGNRRTAVPQHIKGIEYFSLTAALKHFRQQVELGTGAPIQNIEINAALLLDDVCKFILFRVKYPAACRASTLVRLLIPRGLPRGSSLLVRRATARSVGQERSSFCVQRGR